MRRFEMQRHGDDVYFLGGFSMTGLSNKVYRLRDGVWTAVPSMKTPRYAFASALYKDQIYVFSKEGGEAFDIATETW